MSNPPASNGDVPTTLDAPGSIAVIGGGALGVEAALYGRFLGYDVTLFEAIAVGESLRDRRDEPLPMLPARCLSPLAISALGAQQGATVPPLLPTTIGQWISEGLVPLTHSDLLESRVRLSARVVKIDTVAVQRDDQDEELDDIPPDFRLTIDVDSQETETFEAEAVIVATGSTCDIELGFDPPACYFFRIGGETSGDAEQDLLRGFREIVAIFASLGGRADLDLYRPRRV